MKITVPTAVTVLVAFAVALAAPPDQSPGGAGKKEEVAPVVKATNAFAGDLYGQLQSQNGNLFFSPASIEMALAMTYAGASGNTADQMAKTLHLDPKANTTHPDFGKLMAALDSPPKQWVPSPQGEQEIPAYQLSIANALWGQKGAAFKGAFTECLKTDYDANLRQVDYADNKAAADTINKWVADKTKDKIKDLVPTSALNAQTRLVLTNAIYFKSNWAHTFSKNATKDDTFQVTGDKGVKAPMMLQTEHFGYFENDQLQLVTMPYRQGTLSMVVVLPRKAEDMAKVEKLLAGGDLDALISQAASERVDVTLPRFKYSSQFSLGETLQKMGMTDAFDAAKADFSRMTDEQKLFISAVIHKAYIDVNEEGTEAAAATAIMMVTAAMPMKEAEPKVFKADHPFLFLIRYNGQAGKGLTLFAGRVVNPNG